MSAEPHAHDVEELCSTGTLLYARALDEGRIHQGEAAEAPCLLEFGLLHADAADTEWLLPIAPAVALPRLLRGIEADIARQRHRETRLADLFEPLMALDAKSASSAGGSPITVLTGFERINQAIAQAAAESCRELLTVQPGGKRSPSILATALPREQAMLARGARMRTLYQHTARYSPSVLAHYEELGGDVEVRTLDEVTERLVLLDRKVAFIPANEDRTTALEVRHPALIHYLATTFERLWRLATPMWPQAANQPSAHGVTTRQRTIAELLIEGLNDEKIASRLGMNVRTVRVHIAKLAATLGSSSRAQLGFLIGRSGILDREP